MRLSSEILLQRQPPATIVIQDVRPQVDCGRYAVKREAGDTLRVNFKVVEGDRERVQAFEGVCIARASRGVNSSFTVRKISYGEGVERVFPLYSPRIVTIDVVRRGDVRRAKLYYLRGRRGKSARIAERVERREEQPAAVETPASRGMMRPR